MNIMLVGGISMMMRSLSIKLHKEGHRLYVLTGSRNPGNHYPHAFERYDFPYDSPSVEEVFRSVQPDVTILLGAFDGNFVGQDLKREAVRFSAGIQNLLLSWAAMGRGRLIYLSSAEVFGNSYPMPVSEEITPSPRGVRSLMLYQGEESCRFYHEQLGRDVLVLRLDRLHDVPVNPREASETICGSKCLDAVRDGSVSYRSSYHYGLTYLGDAVESINKLVSCPAHREWLYHISSSKAFSERQIVDAICQSLGDKVERIDNTLEEGYRVILSNERLKQEFGFSIWREPEDTIQRSLRYMHEHSFRFLDAEHQGLDRWHRIYYRVMNTLGALAPYLENMVFFIPFFMLNNRATDSRYFSKIDFYLLYVLLFAIVHGQRQATFSAALATVGYLFRQMYGRTGLAVVTDYNTYVWIAEIFILGLTVGYMKDTLRFLREEKEQEVEFLTERVEDIGDINDSNLRVKEGLINQVIDYDNSLGTVYEATEQLAQDQPAEILFHAISTIQQLMKCRDVAIYRMNEEQYASPIAYSSKRAASMGNRVYIPDKKPLEEAFSRDAVYVNRSMEKNYPMMAYKIPTEEKIKTCILIWNLPLERMTIAEANRLVIIGKLIQNSIHRAELYLQSLHEGTELYSENVLREDAFEKLVAAYRDASRKNLTEYTLLQILCTQQEQKENARVLCQILRESDYIGKLSDGNLYVLLSCTDRTGVTFVQEKLEKLGLHSSISEESGL